MREGNPEEFEEEDEEDDEDEGEDEGEQEGDVTFDDQYGLETLVNETIAVSAVLNFV